MVTLLSCLVTALVLSYATGFMLKLRRREFGMYLTLGMTRRNIQTLFACETGLLSGLALLVGMGLGLVIFQLLAALFAAILEIPFAVSAYSAQGILLTLAVSIGLFLLSTLASLRYLKKVRVSELLKEAAVEKSEKHPVLWCVLSAVTLAGFIACLVITYRSLMAAFHQQDGVELLLWLAIDLGMVFLTHFTLSRTLAGMLLRCGRLKKMGTNAVVLRGLSGKMTVNALLIGALATLLVFAIVMGCPRLPIEIVDGVQFDRDGRNVDAPVQKAVAQILEQLRPEEIACAVLQSRSPTCGVNQIYDGSFTGRLISGSGVFAQCLKDAGYRVIDAEDISNASE